MTEKPNSVCKPEHNDINWPVLNAMNAVIDDDVAYFVDGNVWCAVRLDFQNLQESIGGFGDTQELAKLDLERQEAE